MSISYFDVSLYEVVAASESDLPMPLAVSWLQTLQVLEMSKAPKMDLNGTLKGI